MTTRSMILAAPLAIAGALVSSASFAQTTPAQTTPAQAAASAAAAPAPQTHAMVEKRIADLHKRLQVTAAEQPAFDAFASVMRANADRMSGLVQNRRKDIATMTAVDQMKGYQEVAQAHAEDMQRLETAFEHFYDALTPDQKKMADNSFRDFAKSGRS